MKANSAPLPNHRIGGFPINLARPYQLPFHLVASSFVFLCLTVPTSASIPYAKYCNDVVPEAIPVATTLTNNVLPHFQNAYFTGGDPIMGPQYSPKSVSFRTQSASDTETYGVVRVNGTVVFLGPRFEGFSTGSTGNLTRHRKLMSINYRAPRFPWGRRKMVFLLHGFWSAASGKMCMIGSGIGFMHSVNVVFKLMYPNVSSLDSSLVTGTLECMDTTDSLNFFNSISILGLSVLNYQYNLVDKENQNGVFRLYDSQENISLGLNFGSTVCPTFRSAGKFELEYMEDCGSLNCDPLGGSSGLILPGIMSFNDIECTGAGKIRYLLDFSNTSYNGHGLPINPSTMLVAEGMWNEKKKHLDLVGCRIFNVKDGVAKASLGDCSIRLSLRLPSTLSLRNRSSVVGQMWSNKSMNDSGYFGRILFQSPKNSNTRVQGLRYDYTEVEHLSKSCTGRISGKHKKGTYPNGYSSDMRFYMIVENRKGQVSWGYSSPLSVGDRFYEYREMFGSPSVSASHNNSSQSGILNISYVLSFNLPYDFKIGGKKSSIRSYEISAEGKYDAETGVLCMRGCRHLEPHNKRFSKNESLDCEIFISIQYPPLNAKGGSNVKGTIESNRKNSDPLHFERIELSANLISIIQIDESIWKMDLQITMTLISNTLACVFVGLQLFYMKKNPDVLPFISVVMLVILTLSHMVPLVLNFKALFLTNHNQQSVFLGSGGWFEVNEVLVRVITVVAFLLQFRLLQETWSTRVGDGSWVSDKMVLYFTLPLYIGGGLLSWFVHKWKKSSNNPSLQLRHLGVRQRSFLGDFKSFSGSVLDVFLLPQIVFNVFWDSKGTSLTASFYVGTTLVWFLPRAYDIYVNPITDYYSTAWDIFISCSGLMFMVLIYLQQRFGGRCFLPKRFRESVVYEKVKVVDTELITRKVIS